MKSRQLRATRSRLITGFVALAAAAALVTTTAQATTDLLTPPPVAPGTTFPASHVSFSVWRLIPTCDASVTGAFSTMSNIANANWLTVEFRREDDDGKPTIVEGSLAQNNSGSSTVTYGGAVDVSAGETYWVGVKGTGVERFPPNINARSGTQGSLWKWETTGNNRQFTTNTGTAWTSQSSTSFPDLTLQGTCAGGGGGGGGSDDAGPSSGSSTNNVFTLSLVQSLPPGVTCATQVVEGTSGSWVKLPTAQDCTSSSADGPMLLGWATQADFPVQIAQRQVTNGWGAYETFNESGALTGVFIPAGGFTLLSADTDLYPIWS